MSKKCVQNYYDCSVFKNIICNWGKWWCCEILALPICVSRGITLNVLHVEVWLQQILYGGTKKFRFFMALTMSCIRNNCCTYNFLKRCALNSNYN